MVEAGRRIIDDDNVKPFKSPQQKRQRLIAVLAVLIVAGIGFGAYLLLVPRQDVYSLRDYESAFVTGGTLTETTQASGAVTIPVQLELPSPESGFAASLSVAEGDVVVAGQVLGRIYVPDLQNELDDLIASLADTQRNNARTEQQDKFTVARMEREVVAAQKDVDTAQADVDRITGLVKINAGRQSDLDTARTNLQNVIDARSEKEISLNEERQMEALDKTIRDANVAQMQTRIDRLRTRIADSTLRSPMTGEVLNIESVLSIPGSIITANQILFTIADPSSALIELEVDEQYAGLLSVGQSSQLTVSGRKFNGSIVSIGKVAQASSDGLGSTITVKVHPEVDPTTLTLGSSAVGLFELGTRTGVLLLPRGPYITTGSQKYLYKLDRSSRTAERITVTFGETSGNVQEITNGVSEGDEIITSGYQNYIDYTKIRLE